jgi:hypothetical protein
MSSEVRRDPGQNAAPKERLALLTNGLAGRNRPIAVVPCDENLTKNLAPSLRDASPDAKY